MIEPQAQKRGIQRGVSAVRVPGLRQSRSNPGEAGPHQSALQCHQVQQAGRIGRRRLPREPPGRHPHQRQDTGAGLTPEQLAQLFQPFNRLGQEANAEEGTGIGLVVCKRLIELMGGLIGVESVVGKGSVFWIELKRTSCSRNLPRTRCGPRPPRTRRLTRIRRYPRCCTSRTTPPT